MAMHSCKTFLKILMQNLFLGRKDWVMGRNLLRLPGYRLGRSGWGYYTSQELLGTLDVPSVEEEKFSLS